MRKARWAIRDWAERNGQLADHAIGKKRNKRAWFLHAKIRFYSLILRVVPE